MRPELDCGELRLASLVDGLELRLMSSARLSILDSTESTQDIERFLLHTGTGVQAWVSPCMPFRLEIVLHIGGTLPVEMLGSLQQAVMCSIEEPETWQRFGLSCSTVESVDFDNLTSSAISALLTPLEMRPNLESQTAHKIDQEVSPIHLKPPRGIPSLTLNSVCLHMDISDSTLGVWMDQPRGFNDELLTEDCAPLRSDHDEWLKQESRTWTSGNPTRLQQDDYLSNDGKGRETLEAVLRLVDAGIRCAINAHSRNVGRGIQITSRIGFKHLDGIMPAIWAPGYITGHSERVKFLPTISHALMSVASRQSKQSLLGAKYQQLLQRGHLERSSPVQVVSVHLWRLSHKASLRRSSGKKLQLLVSRSQPGMEEQQNDWELRLQPNGFEDELTGANTGDSLVEELLEEATAIRDADFGERQVWNRDDAATPDLSQDDLLCFDSQDYQDSSGFSLSSDQWSNPSGADRGCYNSQSHAYANLFDM